MSIWNISEGSEVAFGTGLLPDSQLNKGRVAGGNYANGAAGLTLNAYGDPLPSGYGSHLASGLGDAGSPKPANSSLAFDQGDGTLFLQPSNLTRRTRAAMSYVWDGSVMNDSVRSITTGVRTVHVKKGIRNNQWDSFEAAWDSGYPETAQSGLWSVSDNANQVDGSKVDDEAQVSRSAQGEFVYQDGSTIAQQDDYDAKTG